MSTRSNSSRERILCEAEALILKKGFAGTSIEEILDKASITKGGFFYHFSDKNALAHALVERYLEQDDQLFAALFHQADSLTEDPLQQLLIFLNLISEKMGELETTHPGCLVAGFTYESQQFKPDITELIKEGVLRWRAIISQRLEIVLEHYRPIAEISVQTLADMFTTSIEGGIILSRIFDSNTALQSQILAYRTFLRVLFAAK